ncbi:hypothetical protein EES43_09670 [Streptomyces sp. ADI96-02]|nr:hypothetical protein [Streptomyces sp. ADI96-02]RPK64463.1 hypothetical protein EES43_09670 [Streptomyces sp. ADI96-02]
MMTIKVYEVDREGRIRVIRPESEVTPLESPEYSNQFPACACRACRKVAS